jgi:hypothetical protein
MTELLTSALLPTQEVVSSLLLRLALNLLVVGWLVRTYARHLPNPGYVFTYVLLNVVTFSVGFLLSKVPIELGFAVGLFGVFGILRYRTEAIPARDLTYLFAVIGVALLNGLSHSGITLVELLTVNVLVAATAWGLEQAAFSQREECRQVVYDRLDLLAPDAADALLADLRQRTRLPITRFEVGDFDLLKDTAAIRIFFSQAARQTGDTRRG